LNNVHFTWQAQNTTFGAAAGTLNNASWGLKTDDSGWDPIPAEGTIAWTDEGVNKTANLKIASAIPDIDQFTGTIVLEFDGKMWHVKTQPYPPHIDVPGVRWR
jgi:hypothetical protein